MNRLIRNFSVVVVAALPAEGVELSRALIALLYAEAQFKHLLQHHDLREENLLYPTLDRVASEEERQELLRAWRDPQST